MNILHFIHILSHNIKLLLIAPIITAISTLLLTIGLEKQYGSSSTIYTGIASGYSIESGDNTRVDYFMVNNSFDNLTVIIKSRETLTKVALSLVTQALMLKHSEDEIISPNSYQIFMDIIPQSLPDLVDSSSFENTYLRLLGELDKGENNFIYQLLNLHHKHYSLEALSKIDVKRIGSSDLIKIDYTNNDPGICKQTLIFLNSIFSKQYKEIKESQTHTVVNYFENELRKSTGKLNKAEEDLLVFNVGNSIINYNEQTKFIAEQREELDLILQNEQMALKGAKAALETLENNMTKNSKRILASSNIIQKKEELSQITSRIALLEVKKMTNHTLTKDEIKEIEKLNSEKEKVKKSLTQNVNDLYALEYTKGGLSNKNVVSEWLTYQILSVEREASLEVLMQRKEDFKNTFQKFAPLGANLKRIERQIGVAESEYLSFLHSLALAKLKQQNIELSSTLKVIDEPNFSLTPLSSKRKLLIMVSGIVTFILIVAAIILIEYFDNTIKTVERAEQFTQLKIAGIFPLILLANKELNYPLIKYRCASPLLQNLRFHTKNIDKPVNIGVSSILQQEGKSFIIRELMVQLVAMDKKVFHISYQPDITDIVKDKDLLIVPADTKFTNAKDIASLELSNDIILKDYDYIFHEIPAITAIPYPIHLLKKFHFYYLICRTNRTWTKDNSKILDIFTQTIGEKPDLVLNGVELSEIENNIGEIQKKRSKLRKYIKKIIQLRFYDKKQIV